MTELIDDVRRTLSEANYLTAISNAGGRDVLIFESATVLGFLLLYENPSGLLENWVADFREVVAAHQLGLRRAQAKSWNAYTVLLAAQPPSVAELVTLAAIEEDLTGTRKIARAGVTDADELRQALLPLLPIQSAPRLEFVDMGGEIRLRTTELHTRAVDAFLSDASEALVSQIFEEEP